MCNGIRNQTEKQNNSPDQIQLILLAKLLIKYTVFISIFCGQTIYTLLGFWISHWVWLQRWKMGSGPLQTCQLCTLGTLSASNRQLSFVVFTDWPITDHSDLMWITLTYCTFPIPSPSIWAFFHSFPGAHSNWTKASRTSRIRIIS